MKSLLLKIFSTIVLNTLRISYIGENYRNHKAIFIFWHGKMFCGWWLFKDSKPGAMISKSKDGELLAGLLHSWGYKIYRGSSSSEGKLALEKIVNDISEISKVVITPDGPRGPAKEIKNGVLSLALKSGLPIIPVRINYHFRKKLKSWDSFEIPFPFSKCDVTFGEPVFYNEFITETELELFKKSLADKMS